MLDLRQKTFNKVKSLLQRQQKELEEEIKSIDRDDPVKNDSIAESSEPGTDSWLADVHGRAVAMKGNLQQVLSRTKSALDKLRRGKYGKCDNCGKDIEPARLEAMPTANLCLSCSKKLKK